MSQQTKHLKCPECGTDKLFHCDCCGQYFCQDSPKCEFPIHEMDDFYDLGE